MEISLLLLVILSWTLLLFVLFGIILPKHQVRELLKQVDKFLINKAKNIKKDEKEKKK